MSEQIQQGRARALIQEMRLDEGNIERRRKAVALDASDLPRIAAIKSIVIPHVEQSGVAVVKESSSK